jgi:hypothetical protein
MSLFDFLLDMDNYEDRVVARDEADGLVIDTAQVSDGRQPFETGVKDPHYNGGDWVIVAAYDTREEAERGHAEWVRRMTDSPPRVLQDCQNAEIGQMAGDAGVTMAFERNEKEE